MENNDILMKKVCLISDINGSVRYYIFEKYQFDWILTDDKDIPASIIDFLKTEPNEKLLSENEIKKIKKTLSKFFISNIRHHKFSFLSNHVYEFTSIINLIEHLNENDFVIVHEALFST